MPSVCARLDETEEHVYAYRADPPKSLVGRRFASPQNASPFTPSAQIEVRATPVSVLIGAILARYGRSPEDCTLRPFRRLDALATSSTMDASALRCTI